ncbi:MAG: High-affinity branched-chain amino acid transport ATP-binding protein LivF [Betaproteobacteria bacterium ADurb.Bin341]|nr:MAG: High-affinity branched-chain amino acid transport ATP-binding protein LivF [Betaproteobacteria bacterium ADurb.Bin341]
MKLPLLKLEGVNTHIGPYHILYGIDFEVPEGELTMLLGRNGAGKTTTLRTIMGMWKASAGKVIFEGKILSEMTTPQIGNLGIAYVPENKGIFTDLTVRENMVLAARNGAPDSARLDWIFTYMPALKKFWEQPSGLLSGGQKQMLSIARAMVEPRRLLLVDEPSKGLAPAIVQNLVEAFKAMKQAGTTILVVEQNFNFAKSLGDTVVVMDNGKVAHRGTMADLAANEALQHKLLGLSLDSHQ